MSKFGDIRSLLNESKSFTNLNKIRLIDALEHYEDNTPIKYVHSYVESVIGTNLWLDILNEGSDWIGEGNIIIPHALYVLEGYESEIGPLTLKACGLSYTWQNPQASVQRATLPYRLSLMNKFWKPWSKHCDQETIDAVNHAVNMLRCYVDGTQDYAVAMVALRLARQKIRQHGYYYSSSQWNLMSVLSSSAVHVLRYAKEADGSYVEYYLDRVLIKEATSHDR